MDGALELSQRERASYLNDACGSDTDLKNEVDSLLFARGGEGRVLENLLGEEAQRAVQGASPFEAFQSALGDSYGIERLLGRGGMAVVYLARDLKHERQVAIKVLRPEIAAALGTERFLREIRTAARLQHPHILSLFDSGEAGGLLYYVMPYVEEATLASKLHRETQLSLDESLRITREVADALDYAHRQGIVHRDIKPGNVLFLEGRAMVADFGLATAAAGAGEEKLTETGMAMGTPAYISPEQASGRDVDGRSDIYSLGCVLYEMLAGHPPFSAGTTQAVLARHMTDTVPPIRTVRPNVPEFVEQAILQALAKVPADRHSTAGEFVDALSTPSDETAVTTVRPAVAATSNFPKMAPAAVVVLLVAAVIWNVWKGNGDSLAIDQVSPSAIAVLPFEVRGSGNVAYLDEAMVDLLSTTLDSDSAPTVDPRTLLAYVNEGQHAEIDPSVGQGVAERFHAAHYVLGSIVEAGGKLRIQATVYDATGISAATSRASVEGSEDELFSLVDSLSAQLLAGQGSGAEQQLGSIAASTTESLPALKAYLEGERALRDFKFEEARLTFEKAVELDPTFALAWGKLGYVAGFAWEIHPTLELLDRALEHADRLSDRDRLRLRAYDAMNRGLGEEAQQYLGAILERQPKDIDALYMLGATKMFYNWRLGRPRNEAREYLERALDLDPQNRQIVFALARVVEVEEAERLARLLPDFQASPEGRILDAFRRKDDGAIEDITTELQTAGDRALGKIARFAFGRPVPSIVELLTEPSRPPDLRGMGNLYLGRLAMREGNWDRAKQHLAHAASVYPAQSLEFLAEGAVLPFVTRSRLDLETLRERLLEWDPSSTTSSVPLDFYYAIPPDLHPVLRLYMLGLVSTELGEGGLAEPYAVELSKLRGPELAESLPQDLARGVRAQVAFNRGRSEEALELLEEAEMKAHPSQFVFSVAGGFYLQNRERFLRAEILNRLGRYQEALGWYESFVWWDEPYGAMLHLRRAQIYEKLGDREKAIEHYSRFVELWDGADAEHQLLVEEAGQRLTRLASD